MIGRIFNHKTNFLINKAQLFTQTTVNASTDAKKKIKTTTTSKKTKAAVASVDNDAISTQWNEETASLFEFIPKLVTKKTTTASDIRKLDAVAAKPEATKATKKTTTTSKVVKKKKSVKVVEPSAEEIKFDSIIDEAIKTATIKVFKEKTPPTPPEVANIIKPSNSVAKKKKSATVVEQTAEEMEFDSNLDKVIKEVKEKTPPSTPLEVVNIIKPSNSNKDSTEDQSAEYRKALNKVMAEDRAKQLQTARRFANWFELCTVNENLLTGTQSLKNYPIIGHDAIGHYRHIYENEHVSLLDQSLFQVKDEFVRDKKKLKVPSVSAIIELSDAPEKRMGLYKWQATKLVELGSEGFEKLQFDLKDRGTNYHKAIERFGAGEPYESIVVRDDLKEVWASLKDILHNDFEKPLLNEAWVAHDKLAYLGRFDSISVHKGTLYLIDWKLTEKPKGGLFDYPLQLVAYLGAFLSDPRYEQLRKKHDVKSVMLVFSHLNGSPPSVIPLSFHQHIYYWMQWLTRVQKFWCTVRILNKISKN